MARHKRYRTLPEPAPELAIASLIDICFLVLIYFLVACTIAPGERDLEMSLPRPVEAANIETPVVLRIEASGEIFAGSGPYRQLLDSDPDLRELPLLRARLELLADASRAAGGAPLVEIVASDQATQQRVIDVLNTLAAVRHRIGHVFRSAAVTAARRFAITAHRFASGG